MPPVLPFNVFAHHCGRCLCRSSNWVAWLQKSGAFARLRSWPSGSVARSVDLDPRCLNMPQKSLEHLKRLVDVSCCLLLVEHGSHCVGHDQWTNLFALLGWRHKISKKCNGRISDSGRSLSLQRDRMWLIVIIYSPGFAWIFLLILISSCTSRTWCHMNLIWASFCPRTSGPEMCTVGMSSLKMFEGVVLLLLLSCAPPLHQRTAKKRMTICQVTAQVKTHAWDTSVRDPSATYVRLFLGEVNAYLQKLEEEERHKMTEKDDYAQSFWSLAMHRQTMPSWEQVRPSTQYQNISKRSCILLQRLLHVLHHGHVRPCFLNLHTCLMLHLATVSFVEQL